MMKKFLKNHLMTLGVVVAVCGALMIIIPTCGKEVVAQEQSGYSEEYLHDYSLLTSAYVHAIGTEEKSFEKTLEEAEAFAKWQCDMVYDE